MLLYNNNNSIEGTLTSVVISGTTECNNLNKTKLNEENDEEEEEEDGKRKEKKRPQIKRKKEK